MTLVEMMVATGVGSVALAAVMALTAFTARSFAAVSNYVDLDTKSRTAVDKISQEIRQADTLVSYAPTQLVLAGKDADTGAAYTLTYTYSPSAKTLTRTKGNETQTLLTQCASLNWYMYQRNMTNGTDSPIPTSSTAECKLIQLNWVCSRNILGNSANTESVQSAEIVIRKK
jgi:hypothetical protein